MHPLLTTPRRLRLGAGDLTTFPSSSGGSLCPLVSPTERTVSEGLAPRFCHHPCESHSCPSPSSQDSASLRGTLGVGGRASAAHRPGPSFLLRLPLSPACAACAVVPCSLHIHTPLPSLNSLLVVKVTVAATSLTCHPASTWRFQSKPRATVTSLTLELRLKMSSI